MPTCRDSTPYTAPIRYYFTPDGEPACGGSGCDGVTKINPGGTIRNPHFAGLRDERVGGGGISGRIRGALGCEDCRVRRKEECYGIPGSHFNGNVRFARDEKASVPAIIAGKPDESETSWHNDIYAAKPKNGTPAATQLVSTPAATR